MNKFHITIIFLLLSLFIRAQKTEGEGHFQWVTAAQSLYMTYLDMEALPDGGVIALAERSPVNFISMDIFFVQGNGEKYDGYEMTQNSAANILMRFNEEGTLTWVQKTNPRLSHIYKIKVSDAGQIDLLVKIYEKERNDDNEPMGYFLDPDDDAIPAGYGIATIDKNGYLDNFRPIKNILPKARPEFQDFERFGEEIILSGRMHKGQLVTNQKIEAGTSGGEFIMAVDKEGNTNWLDIVSFSKKSCCTWGSPSNFDIAPDGTIYFGGMYLQGGVFSNGEVTPGQIHAAPYEKNDAWETFVVCYSPKRKIKWIKTAGSPSRFGNLVATKEGVFIGYNTYGKKSFGKKIKANEKQTTLLTFLNTKGKLKWNKVTEVTSFETMSKGLNGTLIVSGRSDDRQRDKPKKFGSFEFGLKDELFIANLDTQGEVLQFWSADLWTTREPVSVSQNKMGEYFVALQTHCTMKIDMNLIDKSFPKITCYGGSPVLGKVKFR